jgi:hypothetical protein
MRPRASFPPLGLEAEGKPAPLFLPPLGRSITYRHPPLREMAATRYKLDAIQSRQGLRCTRQKNAFDRSPR